MRRSAARLAVLAVAAALTGSTSLAWAEPAAGEATVRFLASRGAVGDWSSYVAAELGYFKDEGISFQPSILSGPAILQPRSSAAAAISLPRRCRW